MIKINCRCCTISRVSTKERPISFAGSLAKEYDFPVFYPNRAYLRPHHIYDWFHFLDAAEVGTDYGMFLSKRNFIEQAKREHVFVANQSRTALLTGIDKPYEVDAEIEYLSLLSTSTPNQLSDEDRTKLTHIIFTPHMFTLLAETEWNLYFSLYMMPESTIVAIVHVLDFLCTLRSQNGFAHCHPLGAERDQVYLHGAAALATSDALTSADHRLIHIEYNKRNANEIDGVFLPLYYFKLKENILYMIKKAMEFEDESHRPAA